MSTTSQENPAVFFPERMKRVEIVAPRQAAYYVIKDLAEFGHVELDDINSGTNSINKRYTETYMECEDADRSLRYIESHLKSANKLPLSPTLFQFRGNLERFNQMNRQEVFTSIHTFDNQLHEKVNIYQQLKNQHHERTMRLRALEFFRPIIEEEASAREQIRVDSSTIELGILSSSNMILSVTGFCPSDQIHRLITTACRATRHNVAYQTGTAQDQEDVIPYTFFVSSSDMLTLLLKICESFGPDVFDFPSDPQKLDQIREELQAEIAQMDGLYEQTAQINKSFLDSIADQFWDWRLYVAREKQIWMAMDYGDFSRDESSVIYTGWTPSRFSSELPLICSRATEESGSPNEVRLTLNSAESIKDLTPPTYIQTNNFSYSFQMLNNAYGIPDYDELNGGAFYAMYPFIFAIMFGDMGHAIFYLLITLAIFVMEPIKRRQGRVESMWETVFKFKWLLFFASICSFYCGFIYDDCFGLPIYFFKSRWIKNSTTIGNLNVWDRDGYKVYPFGIDPEWMNKDNELIFLNSFKMKLSIVMGMTQMVFGMILQLINHIHRRDIVHFTLCWIPEILYLIPFFGYMVVLILKKWLTDFPADKEHIFTDLTKSDGVNIIQVIINMVLSPKKLDADLKLYNNQFAIQTVITIIFVISIPLLLFGKPIYDCVKEHNNPDFSVLEIFVMNLIHVIEFCLSALSHLASYLRLWALSLAHSQLSHVLWDELFQLELNQKSTPVAVILTFVSWAGFACMTVAILLGMEAFSALLHGIRLMWVEFSSKFYSGMGTQFHPLSLKKAVKPLGIPKV